MKSNQIFVLFTLIVIALVEPNESRPLMDPFSLNIQKVMHISQFAALKALELFQNTAKQTVNLVYDATVNAAEVGKTAAHGTVDLVQTNGEKGLSFVQQTAKNSIDLAKEATGAAINNLANTAKKTIDGAKALIKGTADAINESARSAVSFVEEAAKNMITVVKAIAGLTVGGVARTATQSIDGAVNAVEDASVAVEFIQKNSPGYLDFLQQVAKTSVDIAKAATSYTIDEFAQNANQNIDGITSLIEGAAGAVKETVKVLNLVDNISKRETIEDSELIVEHITDAVNDTINTNFVLHGNGSEINSANHFFQHSREKIQQAAKNSIDAAKEAIENALFALALAAKQAIDGVDTIITSVADDAHLTANEAVEFVQKTSHQGIDFVEEATKKSIQAAKEVTDKIMDIIPHEH